MVAMSSLPTSMRRVLQQSEYINICIKCIIYAYFMRMNVDPLVPTVLRLPLSLVCSCVSSDRRYSRAPPYLLQLLMPAALLK